MYCDVQKMTPGLYVQQNTIRFDKTG